MPFKFIMWFLIVLMLSACKTQDGDAGKETIAGEYQSKNMGFIRNALGYIFFNTAYPIGVNLSIEEDSTYSLSTCGNITTGNWQLAGDSLKLFCEINKHKNDSIDQIRGNTCIGELWDVYIRNKDGSLRNESPGRIPDSGKKLSVITVLERTPD